MRDFIRIKDLEVFAKHGVFPEERELGQKFLVSLDLYSDLRNAGHFDDLSLSTNYGEICSFVNDYYKNNTFQLIEAAAENLVREILLRFPLVESVACELKKPWAPIGLPLDYVSVCITRGWHTVYAALGSNMGDKKGYLDMAVRMLGEEPDMKVITVSDYIETEPYGVTDQDVFLNGALKLQTLLTPREVLNRFHEIEAAANRERIKRWGPRTLDLDILLYDDLIVDEEDLCIPHVDMHNRDFVLRPMAQIAPNVRHPLNHKTMKQMETEL